MSKNAEFDNKDDLLLASRAAAGSEGDLAELYRRYADPLFAFIAHRLGGQPDDVEDVFQETWLAALRSLSTYRGEGRMFYWLCGIARHKIADHRPSRRDAPIGEGQELSAERISALVDAGPLPEELLDRLETRAVVVEALAMLPDDYRTVLVARYVDGRSVEKTAQILGKSYKAVESLLSRARAALRTALIEVEREGRDG